MQGIGKKEEEKRGNEMRKKAIKREKRIEGDKIERKRREREKAIAKRRARDGKEREIEWISEEEWR